MWYHTEEAEGRHDGGRRRNNRRRHGGRRNFGDAYYDDDDSHGSRNSRSAGHGCECDFNQAFCEEGTSNQRARHQNPAPAVQGSDLDGGTLFLPSLSDVTSAVPGRGSTDLHAVAVNAFKLHLKECLARQVAVTLGSWEEEPYNGIVRVLYGEQPGRELGVETGSLVLLEDAQNLCLYYGEVTVTDHDTFVLLYNGSAEVDSGRTLLLSNGGMRKMTFLGLSAVLALRHEIPLLNALDPSLHGDGVPSLRGAFETDGRAQLNFGSIDGSRGREWPRTALNLDDGQYDALRAAATKRIAAIHAPLGCGATRFCVTLVKFFIDNLDVWFEEQKRPLLLVTDDPAFSNGVLPKEHSFNLTGKRFSELAGGTYGLPEVMDALDNIHEVLSRGLVKKSIGAIFASETAVLHQDDLKDVTDRFATTIHTDRNFLEEWLFYTTHARAIEQAVSGECSDAYNKYCKSHARLSGVDVAAFPRKEPKKYKRNVYLWKKLRNVEAAPELELVDNIYDLDPDDRWRLYKHWVSRYGKSHKEKLLTVNVNALSARRCYSRILDEKLAAGLKGTPVLVADAKTVVRQRSLVNVLMPRVVIFFGAQRVADFLVPAIVGPTVEQLVMIGDNLDPYQTSAFWQRLLGGVEGVSSYELAEFIQQYFLPQHICDVLEPCTRTKMRSRAPLAGRVKGMLEMVQFFDIPDKEAAIFMLARTAMHLRDSGYGASDAAVLVLSSGEESARFVRSVLDAEEVPFKVHDVTSFYPARVYVVLTYVDGPAKGTLLAAAVSRSVCAFYAFGDFSSADEHCQNILNASKGFTEGKLTLECARHREVHAVVRTCQDFETKLHPNGFCTEPCIMKLPCGHACTMRCHGWHHDGVLCVAPCRRIVCPQNHRCRLACSDPCRKKNYCDCYY